jgi:hypothetical protein
MPICPPKTPLRLAWDRIRCDQYVINTVWASKMFPETNSGRSSDQIIGWKFGTYGRNKRYIQDFGSES